MSPENTQYSEDNILILKGRFKSNTQSIYGQFMVIFNNDKLFDTYNCVVSTYSEVYNLEPHTEWDTFERTIAELKWKGNFNSNLTASLMDQFAKYSEDKTSVRILFDNIFDYDYENVDLTIFDMVNHILHDKSLVLETAIQEVSTREFIETKKKRETAEAPDKGGVKPDNEYSLEAGAVILPVKPILAPVKGRPIYELKAGDTLVVRVQPNSDQSNYYVDVLELREGSEIRPVPAEVVDIKAGSAKNDPITILTSIAPGIYGKIIEDEKQVKLRLYNPLIDGPLEKNRAQEETAPGNTRDLPDPDKPGFSRVTLIMFALFFAILVLFIVLIFISW